MAKRATSTFNRKSASKKTTSKGRLSEVALSEAAIEISSSPKGISASNATDDATVPDSPFIGQQKETSSKRALEDPSDNQDQVSKKSKESPEPEGPTNASPPVRPAAEFDKEKWQGFCEIESDPAYFSVILREMGVQGITVREIFALDPSILENIPQPIYGLILLFRHREVETVNQEKDCPSNVWFANQLPAQNSCSTLAMVNILMNLVNNPDLDIGEHMQQFKNFTSDFTPLQRGEAFDSFQFVKRIHNSFAKKMDILENDKYLAYKVHKSKRLPKKDKSGRRPSEESIGSNESARSFEQNAHHFIGFVPVGNEIWKLDGMDAQPTCMATFDAENGEDWVTAITDKIMAIMAAGDDDYGIIGMCQAPLVPLKKKASLTINTAKAVESRLDSLDDGWKDFLVGDNAQSPLSPSFYGITEDLLAENPVPEDIKEVIDGEEMSALLGRRVVLARELGSLSEKIFAEQASEDAENEKATSRRHDYGPAIKMWLEMLCENGFVEQHLDAYMVGKK